MSNELIKLARYKLELAAKKRELNIPEWATHVAIPKDGGDMELIRWVEYPSTDEAPYATIGAPGSGPGFGGFNFLRESAFDFVTVEDVLCLE